MIQILFLLPAALLFTLTVLNQPLETDNLFSAESKNYAKPGCTTQSGFKQLMTSNISKDNIEVENIKNINNININKNWFDNTIRDLQNDEYNISYNECLGLFQSPNRSNNIRFIYHNDGFSAKTRENKIPLFDVNDKSPSNKERKYKTIPEWDVRLKLNGYTKTENDEYKNLVLFSGNDLLVNKNKASIEDDNVRIDFTNDAEGMRQDFIIKNQISGEGKLKVKFNTETNLSMNVNEDAIKFKDQNGNEKMRYASLKVWDSQGKILKAYFEKSSHQVSDQNISDAKNNSIISKNVKQFCIVVEDENAVYPITIDPISTSPNWITEGNQIQAGYGYSVASAGDVNNDGYSDVIIGAPFYDNGQTNEGKVFVYNGTSAGLLTVALWTAEGNQTDAQFGNSVACAGDINNDGYSDVIIGASVFDNVIADVGRAFVYNGSITGLASNPSWVVESNQSGSQFGWSVSGAGDVNNDGYSDVIVGAPLYSNGQANEGRAFVYHGSAGGLSTNASWTGESNQIGAFYGYSVASAGDVNNDGYSDIIVGATTYDNPRRDEGRVYVYNGSAGGVSNNVWNPTTISSFFANFGGSVSSAGDVNGDGFSDVLIGAYTYDNVETDEGKAYVYYGSSAGLSLLPNWVAESNQAYANFGHSVSSAGDFNKDGFDDIIIGSRRYDNVESDEGAAFLYYGSSSGLSSISNLIFESNQVEAYFGNSVASAGDVNGDGFSDVIAGAYLFDNGQADEGGAFVYYGSPATFKILTLRTYIQGFYNNYSNLMAQDTFKVYLKDTFSPFSTVDSAEAIINPSGIAVLNFSNAENGVDYFIRLKHRNSIETWSSRGLRFENGLMNYNFASDSTQAFGSNMPKVDESPVAFAIYVGDVNQDGFINLIDILAVSNNSSEFINGYVITDLNGDNLTNLNDIIAVYNNSNTFVAGIHP